MNTFEPLTEADLRQFTGTENWYRHEINRSIFYTDGAKHVAEEAGAYWLLDLIAIAQQYERKIATRGFQIWKLLVRRDCSATVLCEDGHDNIIYSQPIPFTDFPLERITLFVANNTIHLPSEY